MGGIRGLIKLDMTGQKWGRLSVLSYAGRSAGKDCATLWNCLCDCGNEAIAKGVQLRRGRIVSCGCSRKERNSSGFMLTHGANRNGARTPEYCAWAGLRSRCNDPKNKRYADWGGRGIKVSPAWDKFEVFLADVGFKPSSKHSIDRIDNNGNYEPGNVKWSTPAEQRRNRRDYIARHGKAA